MATTAAVKPFNASQDVRVDLVGRTGGGPYAGCTTAPKPSIEELHHIQALIALAADADQMCNA